MTGCNILVESGFLYRIWCNPSENLYKPSVHCLFSDKLSVDVNKSLVYNHLIDNTKINFDLYMEG